MAITVQLIGPDNAVTEIRAEQGAEVPVAADQRVVLADVAADDAAFSIDAGDVLALSVGADSVRLPGLLNHIENETGAEVGFADGMVIDSLGALLERAASGDAVVADGEMADLVRDEAHGDLFYLDDMALGSSLLPLPASAVEVLQLGELVDLTAAPHEVPGAAPDVGSPVLAMALADDMWANTELGSDQAVAPAHHGVDGDIIDLLLPGADDLA